MTPNPLILAKGAKAVSAATTGAKAGAAKIALTEKTATKVASTFKSIEETAKVDGWGQLERFSENVKQSKPVVAAMDILAAQFTAETMAARVNLMLSLISLIQSEGFQTALTGVINVVNFLINSASALITFAEAIPDFLGSGDYEHPDVPGYEESPFGTSVDNDLNQPWWEAMGYATEEEALENM